MMARGNHCELSVSFTITAKWYDGFRQLVYSQADDISEPRYASVLSSIRNGGG